MPKQIKQKWKPSSMKLRRTLQQSQETQQQTEPVLNTAFNKPAPVERPHREASITLVECKFCEGCINSKKNK